MNEFYLIGEILSPGKNGFVKVQLEAGFSVDTESLKFLFLDFWGKKKKFEVEEILNTKNSVFFKFLNFDDERDISVLIGRNVFVSGSDFNQNLRDDFPNQIVMGFKVYKNQDCLGIVSNYFEAPANPVIEIKNDNGKEILIPFVHSIFEKIDPERKLLIIRSDYGIDDDDD